MVLEIHTAERQISGWTDGRTAEASGTEPLKRDLINREGRFLWENGNETPIFLKIVYDMRQIAKRHFPSLKAHSFRSQLSFSINLQILTDAKNIF